MATLHDKLLAVQDQLNVPKNHLNAFGKYNYRNCEDILLAVKPLLKEQGLVLTLSDELVVLGDRYYVKATATISADDYNPIIVTAYAREEEDKKGMDASQLTGSTSSYARKYALNGLFLIDDNKDADTTNEHGKAPRQESKRAESPPPADPPTPITLATQRDLAALHATASEAGITHEQLHAWAAWKQVESLRDVESSAIKNLTRTLKDKDQAARFTEKFPKEAGNGTE